MDYYRHLFGKSTGISKSRKVNELLERMPQLSKADENILAEPISVEEIDTAINTLSIGKSPGPDGIGAGFYKKYKDKVTPSHIISGVLFRLER